MSKSDGGFAFPGAGYVSNSGMTIRQYYKAAALMGLLANSSWRLTSDEDWTSIDRTACERADAMIAEDEEAAK